MVVLSSTDFEVQVPCGDWPKDKSLKTLGRFERVHLTEIIEPASTALYTRVLGYTLEQAQAIFAGVRKEFNNRNLHMYAIFRIIYGRKPES